jgi:hypothetical protein
MGIVAAHAGHVARLVVGHDHADRAGGLHVARLGDEVAGAAVDQRDVAAHGQRVGGVERVAGQAGAVGLVDHRHQLAAHGRVGQRRAEGGVADLVVAGGRRRRRPRPARFDIGSSTCGTAAVTRAPFQDRPRQVTADCCALGGVLSTQVRLVRLFSR